MSRRKKSRSLKDKLNVKTGSKKDFIGQSEKGRIPSHNRLAKHKNRPKSAYQQHIEENQLKDTSAGSARPAETQAPREEKIDIHTPVSPVEPSDEPGFDELSGDELLDKFDRN